MLEVKDIISLNNNVNMPINQSELQIHIWTCSPYMDVSCQLVKANTYLAILLYSDSLASSS